MKSLIVEDEFICRQAILVALASLGHCDVAVNGQEAVEAFKMALDNSDPYDLICLDIMLPELNGMDVLQNIRQLEVAYGIRGKAGVKVIMTTSMDDKTHILGAFRRGCEAYITKPVTRDRLLAEIEALGLVTTAK